MCDVGAERWLPRGVSLELLTMGPQNQLQSFERCANSDHFIP